MKLLNSVAHRSGTVVPVRPKTTIGCFVVDVQQAPTLLGTVRRIL
jgi:hypothetical protein